MKKVIFSVAVAATLGLTSCGGGANDALCGCAEKTLEMSKEMEGLTDMAKLTEVMKKYETELKACETTFKDFEKTMEGKSDDEKKAAEEDLKNSCSAFKEISEMKDKAMSEAKKGMEASDAELDKLEKEMRQLESELTAE